MPFTVYLLKQRGQIVYIGQSKDVARRRQPSKKPPPPRTQQQYKQYDEVVEWRSYPSRREALWAEDSLQHSFVRKYGRLPKYNRGCSLGLLGGPHAKPNCHGEIQRDLWYTTDQFPNELIDSEGI